MENNDTRKIYIFIRLKIKLGYKLYNYDFVKIL